MGRLCKYGPAWVAGIGILAGVFSPPAAAGDLPWDEAKQFGAIAVRERPRSAFEPDGIRVGNFLLFPSIGVGTGWIGSGFPGGKAGNGDFRHELDTNLEVRSQLSRHFIALRAHGRAVQYHERDEIQYIDGGIGADLRIDIDHATSIFGGASFALRHSEDVDEERPLAAAAPPEIATYSGQIGIARRSGRIDASVGLRYSRVEYKDAVANDGSRIELGWQDYSVLSPFAQLGWRISPRTRVFGEVAGNFQENEGTEALHRNARGISGSVGLEFELSPLVRVALKGGYTHQDYLQAGLLDISEPTWEGRLQWLITPLVTLTFATQREVRATFFGGASGALVTKHGVRADYEIWRNLIATAHGSLSNIDYMGTARRDTALIGGVSLEYLHTKNWATVLSYEHQELSSNFSDYDRSLDKFGFSVRYRF